MLPECVGMTWLVPSISVTQRLAEGVCQRAFSSPEAFLYEMAIAPALVRVVEAAALELLEGPRLLDVGCGSGRLATAAVDVRTLSYVGVDPSAAEIRRLARRHHQRLAVRAVLACAESLPFESESFDTVVSAFSWKHWITPDQGISECLRVARPGGMVIIIEVDGSSSEAEFAHFADISRVPFGLRRAYVRFAMRTVVGVAPRAETLVRSFEGAGQGTPEVRRIGNLPFLIAFARRAGPARALPPVAQAEQGTARRSAAPS